MFQTIANALTGFLKHNNNPWGFFLLGAAALLEYVFPPFPGDTITLFGAFLVTRYAWRVEVVFVSVLLGSALGAMVDFYVGIWIGHKYQQGRVLQRPQIRRQVEKVLQNFRKYGEAYVALNRFLPAVRAVFFLAAGMAGLRAHRVLFFALISAAAWNLLLIGAGYSVGANWDGLKALFKTYSLLAWLGLTLVVVALAVRWAYRRFIGGPPPH